MNSANVVLQSGLYLPPGGVITPDLWRVHDAPSTPIVTAASDDLGIVAGTYGTSCPYVTAGDCKAATVTRYARHLLPLWNPPEDPVSATGFKIGFLVDMVTTVADTSCTIDLEAYDIRSPSEDLCQTAAQDMNSMTEDWKFFVVDISSLKGPVLLDLRVKIACVDGATQTGVGPAIRMVTYQRQSSYQAA